MNSTWLRPKAAGKFPVRVRLSPGRMAGLQREILDLIAHPDAERTNGFGDE
jgi:hypothetical protein